MRTVREVCRLTGVTVRALHHYDAIGLLKPTRVTEAGYRLYDDAALRRLQSILLFRELQFPLKQIKAILDNPGFEQSEALTQQIRLLELQYAHIGKLIAHARAILNEGTGIMEFQAFDKSEIEKYREEAKARWGTTQAYREYEERARAGQDFAGTADQLMAIFAEIGALRQLPPEDSAVMEKIAGLQAFITAHYYTCTAEILSGLGEMYVSDDRMKRNIDCAGGEGTAEFVRRAIQAYCAKQ